MRIIKSLNSEGQTYDRTNMSLVAYGDSDENSDNDSGEPSEQPARRVVDGDDNGIEVQEQRNASNKNEDLLIKHSSKNDKQPDVSDDNFDKKTKPKSIGNLFSSLPAPWMSSVTWASKDGGRMSAKKDKRQQSVKISLPVAEESDSDGEAPEKEEKGQICGSQKHSGLSSLLPKPKHSVVVKENNPNRPMTKISNRPLIPDSLRRKQVKGAKTLPQHKKPDSDDEDDDQESVSFFSFGEQESVAKETSREDSQDVKPEIGSVSVGSELWNSSPYDTSPFNVNSSNTTNTSSTDFNKKANQEERNDLLISQPSFLNTRPDPCHVKHSMSIESPVDNTYTFGEPANQETTTTYYSNSGESNAENQAYSYEDPEPYSNYGYDQYNQSTQQSPYGVQWQPEPTVHDTPQQTAYAPDKVVNNDDVQFKKLQGKRARGEENINIIDVNADDQIGSTSEWKSRYKREDGEYKPQSKKKGNMPSSQQRRKHQITYLAFQAKESEWELRNQWAASSQTRRQTQSKYGF